MAAAGTVYGGCDLTFVGAGGATGIRLCAWWHQSTVSITAPATKALRSSTLGVRRQQRLIQGRI
jgi:hypothetical protein